MKCQYCHKEIKGNGVLLNADGDFGCDNICKDKYEKERDRFLNVTIHDDKLYKKWWDK